MNCIPRKKAALIAETFEDQFIIYDNDSGSIHVFNATAYAILEMLDGNSDLRTVAEKIAKDYLVKDVESVFEDVKETVEMLKDKSLIECR